MTKTTKSRTSPVAEDVDIDAPRVLRNRKVLSLPSKSGPASSMPPFKVGPPKGVSHNSQKKSTGTVDNAEGQHMNVTANNVPLAEVNEGRNATLDPTSTVPLFKVGPPKRIKKSTGTAANTTGQHKKVTADDAPPAEGDEGNMMTDTHVQTTEKVKAAMIEAFEVRFRSPRPSTVLPLAQKDRPRKRATLYTTPLDSSVRMTGGIGVFDDQEHQGDEDHIDDQREEAEVEAEAEGSLQDDEQQEEDEVSTAAQGLPCLGPWRRPVHSWVWCPVEAQSLVLSSSPTWAFFLVAAIEYALEPFSSRCATNQDMIFLSSDDALDCLGLQLTILSFSYRCERPGLPMLLLTVSTSLRHSPHATDDDSTSSSSSDNVALKRKKAKMSHSKAKPVAKGKGKAIDQEEALYPKKCGNLSADALTEIREFADDIKTKASELGQRYGKSARDILVAAGLGVKPSHTKVNDANLFRSWYWATKERASGVGRNEFNDVITSEYHLLMQGIPKDDIAARRDKMKDIYKWSETNATTASTNRTVKSVASRVDSAKTQFSGLAEAWCNLEDIEIVGAVIPPEFLEALTWFADSSMTMLLMCAITWTSILLFSIQSLRNGDGGKAAMPPGVDTTILDLRCRHHESPRDHNRRVLGVMCREKFIEVLKVVNATKTQEKPDPTKMCWQKFLDLAFELVFQSPVKDQKKTGNWTGLTPVATGLQLQQSFKRLVATGSIFIADEWQPVATSFSPVAHKSGQKTGLDWTFKHYFEYQIRVRNWPKYTPSPHPQFDVKAIKSNPLRRAVFPYLTRNLGSLYDNEKGDDVDPPLPDEVDITLLPEIQMEVWDETELELGPRNPAKSKVPLVIADDGTHLAVVADALKWQKARHNEEVRCQELAAAAPKKKSYKRPCVELTDEESPNELIERPDVLPMTRMILLPITKPDTRMVLDVASQTRKVLLTTSQPDSLNTANPNGVHGLNTHKDSVSILQQYALRMFRNVTLDESALGVSPNANDARPWDAPYPCGIDGPSQWSMGLPKTAIGGRNGESQSQHHMAMGCPIGMGSPNANAVPLWHRWAIPILPGTSYSDLLGMNGQAQGVIVIYKDEEGWYSGAGLKEGLVGISKYPGNVRLSAGHTGEYIGKILYPEW
ncbi:hypothetical protein BU15DRAFT_66895 [Melanogaster broomeanus]|nr:hypothetical protein BU15DRAFT_66895 [Melanogaster broomeanus]